MVDNKIEIDQKELQGSASEAGVESNDVDKAAEQSAILEKIKTNIEEIKTSVEEVKKEMDDFDKEKKDLAKDVLDKKQEEIDQKKLDIEAKKKETKELIAKLKTELAEKQKNAIDQKLAALDAKIIADLDDYDKELDAITPEKKTFWEKTKNWVKEHKKPLLIGGGILAGIFLLRRLFRRKKKDSKEGGEGKKEKKPWWKKVLMRAGGITGGILVWKNWDKIKNWFGGLFEKNTPPENIYKSDWDSLSEEMKQQYFILSDDVDSFAAGNVVEFDKDTQKNKQKKSEIIFDLDKNIPSLAEFNSTETLNYMTGQTTDDFLDILQNGAKSLAYESLSKFLMRLESFKPFGATFFSDPVASFNNRLKSGTPEEHQKELSLFYRQYMNVLNYVTEKKELILERKAKELIIGKDQNTKELSDEQKELIEDQLKNEDWCKEQLKNYKLSDIPSLMKIYSIEVQDISQETKDIKTKLDDEKKEILQVDDEGVSVITKAEQDFDDGEIDKCTREELIDVCEDLGDDLFGNGSKMGFFGAYTHLLTDVFKGNQEMVQNYMKEMHFDELIDEIKLMIKSDIAKLENNTFTKDDLQALKSKIDDYFVAKENFTIHMNKIKGSNNSRFSFGKVFTNVFVNSFKDIGMAFGKFGGTNSWGERIGRGLGGAVVSGGILYITGTFFKPFAPVGGTVLKFLGKPAIKIGMAPAELIKRGITNSLGRTYLTGIGWSEAILNPLFSASEKKRLIAYAFLKGEITEQKARILFESKAGLGMSGITTDQLLLECGLIDPKQRMLFQKYGNNKNIRNLLFAFDDGFQYVDRKTNVKNNFVNRILKKNVTINKDIFLQLNTIDDFLGRCTHAGKSSLVNGFLETTKSLKPEMIQEIFATQTFDTLSIETSKDIGRLLGKNIHKFSSLDDFKNYQAFFARNYSMYSNKNFVANSLSKWKILKGMDEVAQSKYIESAKLNLSTYEKISIKVKDGVNSMIKELNIMLKNPKFQPFYNGITNKITSLTDYVKTVTPDSIKALGDSNWLDSVTGFSKLTPEGVQALNTLKGLLVTDQALLKSLQGAKNLDEVKDVLTRAGIDVSKIDDGVLLKISQTKDASKIKSIVHYGSEIDSINALKKIFTNPAMKSFGKWLGYAGVVLDFGFVGYEAVEQFGDAEEIKKYNTLRGSNKESEAYFDVISGGTSAALGLAGMLMLAGAANSWNPVGWGCLITAAGITITKEVADLYYGEINTFTQNYQDFLKKSLPDIKQDIIHINNWQTGLDSSFQDKWSKLTGTLAKEEKEKISLKTSADAVKSLIYFEELQNYPLAVVDLNSPDARQYYDVIVAQKDAHEKAVEQRFTYIKTNYIDNNKPLISEQALKENNGIETLDKLLQDSRIYHTMLSDTNTIENISIDQYQKTIENDLKQNLSSFQQLEDFSSNNPVEFYKMVLGMPQYESLLNQYSDTKSNYQELIDRLNYVKKYINYKMLGKLPSDLPKINFDLNFVDYTQIENFLLSFDLVATSLGKEDLTKVEGIQYLDEKQVLETYNVSSTIGQNILFEIAQDLGYVAPLYSGKNNLVDLKNFFSESKKESQGIYFDGTYWCVNENWGSDNEFANDNQLNDIKNIKLMKQYIQDSADSRNTGKMTNETTTNKELSKNYINIIDKEIWYREHPSDIKKTILEYIKTQSNGDYIQLPADLIIQSVKAGFKNVAAFVYCRDGKKFETKTDKKSLVSDII